MAKDLGDAKKFVGVEITRLPDGSIILSQKVYIEEIIRRFHLDKNQKLVRLVKKERSTRSPSDERCVRTYHTPMSLLVDVNNSDCEDSASDVREYQSMIGSIMCTALGTRLDVTMILQSRARRSAAGMRTKV